MTADYDRMINNIVHSIAMMDEFRSQMPSVYINCAFCRNSIRFDKLHDRKCCNKMVGMMLSW